MSKFKDDNGKESMIRKISWLIVITSLVWGSAEIVYSFFVNDFTIHSYLILSTLLIGVGGKVGQSFAEKFKK